jgi:hypothetical protein
MTTYAVDSHHVGFLINPINRRYMLPSLNLDLESPSTISVRFPIPRASKVRSAPQLRWLQDRWLVGDTFGHSYSRSYTHNQTAST